MNRLEIPAHPDDLTPRWLTAALRQSKTLEDAAVSSVSQEPLGTGRGFAGQTVRLRLDYDMPEPGAPRSLVAKVPAADSAVRTALHTLGIYTREVRFYQDLAMGSDAPTPHVFYADVDSDTPASVLLLEDLTAGRVGDNLAGCSHEEAVLAVSQLGRFHARWWDHPRLDGMPWLAPIDHDQFSHMLQQQWEPFRAKLDGRLPAALASLGAGLIVYAADYHRWLSAPPHAIMHGDFRLDNLFFGNRWATRPLTIFDWQTAALGHGVADVAYFAAFCLPIDQRRRTEGLLVRHYHEALLAGGVHGYDIDQCWADYQLATLGAFLRLISAGALLDFSDDRATALAQALMDRTEAIVTDHGVEAMLVRKPRASSSAIRVDKS